MLHAAPLCCLQRASRRDEGSCARAGRRPLTGPQVLFKYNCDVLLRTPAGEIAKDLAIEKDNQEIINLLDSLISQQEEERMAYIEVRGRGGGKKSKERRRRVVFTCFRNTASPTPRRTLPSSMASTALVTRTCGSWRSARSAPSE